MSAGTKEQAELRRGCDLAVEATAVPQIAAGLVDFVGNGGAAPFFGVRRKDARIEVSPLEMFRRQLSPLGTHSLNHNIPEALDAIAAIGPAIEDVVTHRPPLDGIAEVVGGHRREGSMKVQLAS